MNLYEIDAAIEETFDHETGEILDTEALDALQMERDRKIENIGLYIKNETALAEQIKAEMASLKERKEKHEKKAESLRNYLTSYLDGGRYESARVKVTFRKSTRTVIDDENAVPDSFCEIVQTRKVDKKAIADAIKEGLTVTGAHVEENQNIQIK